MGWEGRVNRPIGIAARSSVEECLPKPGWAPTVR